MGTVRGVQPVDRAVLSVAMKVLLTVASLRLHYGGPANSVSQLAMALSREGAQVGVWAPDGSGLDTQLIDDNTGVARLAGDAKTLLAEFMPDVLHDNGIWLPYNHSLSRISRANNVPRVVSLRGMLDPWALRHKAAKKTIAWALYQKCDLRHAAHLHATAQVEAQNIHDRKLGVPVTMIPNGTRPMPANLLQVSPTRPPTALFLGRIYPVKGLLNLVEAWARTQPHGWRLDIAGPDEAGHQAQVQAAISKARLEDVIRFIGPVSGADKTRAFTNADLLVLPSHSESFGMVVGEALAHGVPVLTTTAVPWPDLETSACGWRVAPTAEGLSEGLLRATGHSRSELAHMGELGRQLISQNYSWPASAKAFLKLYEGTIGC